MKAVTIRERGETCRNTHTLHSIRPLMFEMRGLPYRRLSLLDLVLLVGH